MKFIVFNDREERVNNLETHKQERRAYAGNLDHLELATKDDHIKKYYRLLYKDNSGVWREYIVTDIEEVHDIDGTSFYIYAENSLIETKWAFIEDKRSYDQYPQNAINIALSETRWTGVTTVTENRNVNFYRISAFEAIESIMETWDLEILTEINVSKTKILSRKLYFQPRVGRSLDKRFSWTKDMTEISRRVNDDEIITALYGFGKSLPTEGGGFGRKIDFSEINNGLMYVANEEAKNVYGYLGKNGLSHRFGQVNINTDDKEELLRLTQEKLEEVSKPKITYKASVVDLASYGYEFEDVEVGDFVGVRDKELNIAIKARITELVEDLDGIEPKKLVIGNFVNTVASDITSLKSNINNLSQTTEEQINQVANTVKQTADGQNHIFFGPDEPTAYKVNDIWFKLLPSGVEVMYRWNGTAWVEILDPQKFDHLQTEILTVQSQAQQAVEEAEQATQEAIKAITGLATKAEQTDLEKTETDILSLQSTKADLTDLQKNETDILAIQGRLDPTMPDSLAYQVARHTSTIAEQGGRLETLRGDFDSLEIGGRNLLQNSGDEVTQRGSRRIFSNLVVGEEYTFQVEYEIVEGTPSSFLLYLNGSRNYWVQAPINDTPIGKTKVTFIPPNENVVPNLNLYTGYNGQESQTVTVKFKNMKLEKGNIPTDWTPAPEDLATSQELNEYKQTSEGYFQRIQAVELDLASGVTYTKLHNLEITAAGTQDTIAQLRTDVDGKVEVTAYNQKISTIEGDVQTIKGELDESEDGSLAQNFATYKQTVDEQGGRLETLRGDFDGLEIPVDNLFSMGMAWTGTGDGVSTYRYQTLNLDPMKNYRIDAFLVDGAEPIPGFFMTFVGQHPNPNLSTINGGASGHVIAGGNPYQDVTVAPYKREGIQYPEYDGKVFMSFYPANTDIDLIKSTYRVMLIEDEGKPITKWHPNINDLATSKEFNNYRQTSEGYFQRVQSIETDLKSGLTYTKINDIKQTADETKSTLATITDGDVTAYNQKISTALGDIQTIKDADYSTQISNIAGRINVQIVDNADGSKSMMDMTSNQLLYNIDGGKIQVTKDKFYMDQTLIVPIIQTTKLSATQIESGTLDANKANIINLNVANLVGQNADLIRGSFNAINSSINIDGTALTTKGNWGGDIKLSNRGLTIYDNLANKEMGILYGLFRNDDDPYASRFMLGTGLFASYGYKLNIGLRKQTNNANYSVISLDTAEDTGMHQMNVFGDILARYDLKMFGGMLTGAANAGYTVTEANGGHCFEFANGWKIQFWRSPYQTYSSGWTDWTFPKRFTSLPKIVLAQAVRDDENLTLCHAFAYNYQACNIRIQNKTLPWTIVAIAIGN